MHSVQSSDSKKSFIWLLLLFFVVVGVLLLCCCCCCCCGGGGCGCFSCFLLVAVVVVLCPRFSLKMLPQVSLMFQSFLFFFSLLCSSEFTFLVQSIATETTRTVELSFYEQTKYRYAVLSFWNLVKRRHWCWMAGKMEKLSSLFLTILLWWLIDFYGPLSKDAHL